MEQAGRERPRSWTARVLAPLALVATVLVALLVVLSSVDGDDASDADRERDETTTPACTPAADDSVRAGYYVIQAEDTAGLSAVAEKTCIPVTELTQLNPNLDTQQIVVGNCVDLVTDGCKALADG